MSSAKEVLPYYQKTFFGDNKLINYFSGTSIFPNFH